LRILGEKEKKNDERGKKAKKTNSRGRKKKANLSQLGETAHGDGGIKAVKHEARITFTSKTKTSDQGGL